MGVLSSESGVGSISRLTGAEAARSWDLVEAEVADDVAKELIGALASLEGSDDLSITLTLASDRETYLVKEGRPVLVEEESSDAGVVSAASLTLRRLVRVDYQYVLLMVSAAVIATAGLIANLPIAIVGAMAISPDLGRLNAIAFALIAREPRLLLRGAGSLGVGMVVAIVTAFVGTLLLVALGTVEDPLAAIPERLVDFISDVDPVTVTVALAAGIAAMVVFITDRGRAAVGVGVSITTIPAAVYAGIAAADGQWSAAADGLTVLLVNITAGAVAEVLTGVVLRSHLVRRASSLRNRSASTERSES